MNHSSSSGGSPHSGSNREREIFTAVEALLVRVRRAKRAADESLKRVNAAPQPHTQDNPVFAAVAETHMADREALFAAMRELDVARARLRSASGTKIGAAIGFGQSASERRAG